MTTYFVLPGPYHIPGISGMRVSIIAINTINTTAVYRLFICLVIVNQHILQDVFAARSECHSKLQNRKDRIELVCRSTFTAKCTVLRILPGRVTEKG